MQDFLNFLKTSTSPAVCVSELERRFAQAGYEKVVLGENWTLERGKGYYLPVYGTTLIAFRVNPGFGKDGDIRISASHVDWPCFKVKPSADSASGQYARLNVEAYGGAILNTWMDRPLSLSGSVAVRGADAWHPELRLFDAGRPVAVIPNVAIHMNREMNKGVELMKQTDMLPLVGFGEQGSFLKFLSGELKVEEQDILDYDLTLYNRDEPEFAGLYGDLLTAPRLDNLTSVYGCLYGLLNSGREKGLDVAAFFDNEEVGSQTKQGACSLLLNQVLEKIFRALGLTEGDCFDSLCRGMMLSVDVAHGTHPNHPEKNDPTNPVPMGRGFAIKMNFAQRYATDPQSVSILEGICREKDIPCQKFVNHSNLLGGSTLGAKAASFLTVRTVDIGVPILAMHSARETMAAADQTALNRCLAAFYG